MNTGEYPFALEEAGQQQVRLRCLRPYPAGDVRVLLQGAEIARLALPRAVQPGQVIAIPIRRLPAAQLPTALHFTSILREPVAPPLPLPDAAAARRLMTPGLPEPPPSPAAPPPAPPPLAAPPPPAVTALPFTPPPAAVDAGRLAALEARVAALESQLAALAAAPPPPAPEPAAPEPAAPEPPMAEPAAPERAAAGPLAAEPAPAVPPAARGDSALVVPSAFHFRSGWYQLERDPKGEFRWMASRALVTNPEPGRRVRAARVEVAHIYQQALQGMGASFDTRGARLVDVGGERNLVLHFTPEDGAQPCDGLWLTCSKAASPAADGASADDRTLSVAVLGVEFVYG